MTVVTRSSPVRPDPAAIRRRIVGLSHQARSAHLGSSLSCVEILNAVLAVSDIRPETASVLERDRMLLSKGHAAMACYSVLEAWGLIDTVHLDRYLKDDTALWGHVTRTDAIPAIDASTGSLGHGLGLATGFALGARLRRWPKARAFCIMSDGECDEGSVWEAALFAGHHRLGGLTAVVDYNKIQSLERCADVMDLEPFADKWRAFRWDVVEVDGHDEDALIAALTPRGDQPRAIIAHTVKGKGLPRIENTVASHYHPATADDVALFGG
ncbi:transketolase [Azospirillum sp. YIM DDC1]|uniref:Transketolase n=1 Tax=Azospirillum aestuarii TaxID=2802052 RepID=A0ABS1I701_9PROT|nr:transketolase [Azospirillum aestuarii]MBK4722827.1 transketolase [Azospirillum aestuarii]